MCHMQIKNDSHWQVWSQVREQYSTSAPNPPNVTNTEPSNGMIDGYIILLYRIKIIILLMLSYYDITFNKFNYYIILNYTIFLLIKCI